MAEGNTDSTTTTNIRNGTFILVSFYTLRGTSRHEALDRGGSRTPAYTFLTFSGRFYTAF